MSEGRCDSRVSFLTESTIVNQGLSQMDSHRDNITYAGLSSPKKKSPKLLITSYSRPGQHELGPSDGAANHLVSRLYDGEQKALQSSENNEDTYLPRPPIPTAVRTTMFKRDYQRRQKQVHGEEEGPPIISVAMLHKPSRLALNATGGGDGTLSSFPPLPAIKSDPERMTSPLNGAAEDMKSWSKSVARPLSADRQRVSLPPASRQRQVSSKSIRSMPDLDKTEQPVTPSRRQDPTLVLTYLQKNKYDDTVPENDDVVFNLKQFREKLGWKTDIPRYGPNSKAELIKKMSALKEPGIQLAEDEGKFMYCLPRNRDNPRGRYNPYDLQVVSADRAQQAQIYWTISASHVTMWTDQDDGAKEAHSTSALWWLWERRLFNMIHDIPVFVKFRTWKTFVSWRANVRHQTNSTNQVALYKTLFIANEILQGCLFHVRSLCELASSSHGGIGYKDNQISLVNLDKLSTFTLQEFQEIQKTQGEKALAQLNALREKIVKITWESCATVAEMEGIRDGIRANSPSRVTIKLPKSEDGRNKYKDKLMEKYGSRPAPVPKAEKEKLIFKDKPLYAEIAEWRKILKRLSAFLRSVDYLLQELLHRLVITALRQLLNQYVASYNVGVELSDNEYSDSDSDDERTITKQLIRSLRKKSVHQKKVVTLKVQPKEYVIPKYDFDKKVEVEEPPDIDAILDEIQRQGIVEEVIAPVFSLQLELFIEPKISKKKSPANSVREDHATESCVSEVEKEDSTNDSPVARKTVSFPEEPTDLGTDSESEDEVIEFIERDDGEKYAYTDEYREEAEEEEDTSKISVLLSPSKEDFKSGINSVLVGFKNIVGQAVSLLREPKLATFYSGPKQDLQLHFDKDEEQERQLYQRPWPDLEFMFGNDEEYQTLVTELFSYIEMELSLVENYSTEFDQFCSMVDKARRLQIKPRDSWGREEYHQVLAAYTDMIKSASRMRVSQRIAMIQVLSQQFRDSCLPHIQLVMDTIHCELPIKTNDRNEVALTVIKGALDKLDHYPINVEEFVEHLTFLARMSNDMPALEKEVAVISSLVTIIRDYDINIEPEQLALFKTLVPSFQHLKTTILFCEAKKDENIRKFSSDLNSLIHNIRHKLVQLQSRIRDPDLLHEDTIAVSALENIRFLQDEVDMLAVNARSYSTYQDRFGSSLHQVRNRYMEEFMLMDTADTNSAQEIQAEISDTERDLTLRRMLWESTEEWMKLVAEWTATLFDSLKVEGLQKAVSRFTQTIHMLEKGLPHNDVVPRLKTKVIEFKQGMPVITSLRNPSLRQRHWTVIEQLIGKKISKDKSLTLGNLLEMNIFKHKEKIQDISTTASNEATLEVMLQKVIDLWQHTDFRLVAHAGRSTHVIVGTDDIIAQLEESQVTVGTIRGSRYVGPIKGLVEEWERKLQVFYKTLEEWLTCQRNWIYLEQIFSTPDIQRQLPSEHKLFNQVDRSWKEIMQRVSDRPNALKAAIAPGTVEMLQSANFSLEKIQKCLEDYLETKRLVFPRFYFLSNDELLDILAQSKDPSAVQPHLGKCFGNIKSLDIKQLPRQPPTVRSMTSLEGEVVNMPRNLRARGPLEQWLGAVEAGMFETVKKHLKLGLADWSVIKTEDWVLKHPGQVLLTVTQIMFSKEVVRCFDEVVASVALAPLHRKMVELLKTLAGLVSTDLYNHQRMSLEAQLIVNVHNRDIVNNLIKNKVQKKEDFDWSKQLRYEWDEQTNNCLVHQSNATFHYGYEYLGASARLVITPLTDRCYLTLTGALHLHLGGSPAGPAGTGKTETVKDLAKAMGKQCVVFNCSEGLDYKMLGKFFSGLAQSGSWCCFDEFNRIDVEVLSVVAQQIHSIKTAKDAQTLRFMFEGRDIKLNMTCGFFITMNPTYAGRVDLPDNLKSLFRPVAMMIPDYALIAEIMLFSEGFTDAKSLSQKLVNLYQLASCQLSQQDHYDFGMRAIKSVLIMAGHSYRDSQKKAGGASLSDKEESHILIHSLRDANLPKFIAEDVPLFESILADLFPGITPPEVDQGFLEKAISMAVRDLYLQHWPSQIEKVKQFYNQIMVRHGIMLVGPTCGGKTTVRNILQRALVLLPSLSESSNQTVDTSGRRQSVFVHNRAKKGHVETVVLNPKCVNLGELYGQTDPVTFEWTDGLIANATRKFAKESSIPPPVVESDLRTTTSLTESSGTTVQASTITTSYISSDTPSEAQNTSVTNSNSDRSESEAVFSQNNWQWLILDGPVDTLWVENMNTVLDDSKVLCLANGERIGLTSSMRLIFEVDNLSQASPATVSRCAMVYMDPVDLGWKPYVKTWLTRLPKDFPEMARNHLQALFDHSVDVGFRFINKYKQFLFFPVPDLSIISCLCNILSALLDFIDKNGGFGIQDKEEDRPGSSASFASSHSSRVGSGKGSKHHKKRHNEQLREEKAKLYYLQSHPGQLLNLLGKLYVFAYTWSFGSNFKRQEDLEDDVPGDIHICSEFDNFMHEKFEIEPPLGVRLPSGNNSIYSYFIDMETGNFASWDVLVPSTKSLIEKGAVISLGQHMGFGMTQDRKGASNGEADIVPTVDILRFSFLTSLLLLNRHQVLLTGDSGAGKSTIINHLLKLLGEENGTSTKRGTILGNILNYSSKSSSLLEDISNLTKFGQDETDEANMDLLIGSPAPKPTTGIISSMVQFSAQTSASRIQQQITHRLIKKGRETLGAPRGKKVVIFVDDLNMPSPDKYGAQPPLELLKQFLESGGFFDTQKLVWKDIVDVTLVSACGPPGGGRHPISPRLLKHFCILALPQPSTRSLQHIYQVKLGQFFKEGEFMPEVSDCLLSLISASVSVYYHMYNKMLPTPTKSHYTFNIRDLSKVIQGLLQADESIVVNKENMVQLFAHEATRVFHDRLISAEDRSTFFTVLADNLNNYFKVQWSAESLMSTAVLFGDFFSPDDYGVRKIYRPMQDYNKLAQILEEYYMKLHMGNSQIPQMVFFKECIEHIVRAARIFRQPGGHMMLVGVDGTGKMSVVKLASYIAACNLVQISLNKSYGVAEFHDDIKNVFQMSGVQGLNTVFLLTDDDIVNESFLEDINCILNSGEVPDLFDNDELDNIAMELKSAATDADVQDTRPAVYQFFIQRVRRNLHLVLTMSPAGGRFRQRCRMNPALINCCTIDWYDEWNKDAMLNVAHVFFQKADFVEQPDKDVQVLKDQVALACVEIHQNLSVMSSRFWIELRRHYYTTPSSYMELIRVYTRMLKENKDCISNNKERLQIGLQKISEANSLVGTMQVELVELGPKIEEKARDTEVLLKQLEKEKEAVGQVEQIVTDEESIMKRETQIVQNYADECQSDLAAVLPALQMAIASLDSLDKASIAELRVYTKPPLLVNTVMAAVCTLFRQKPDWTTAKQLLGEPNFLKKMIQFDRNSLPEKVFVRVKKYSKHPDFNPEAVGKVSVACRSICEWVLALEHYNEVYKMVRPRQRRVEEAKEALQMAQDNLARKQTSLRKIQDHLRMLQQQCEDSVNQRESLKERKKLTGIRLQRASVLITALSDEKVRWTESVNDLEIKLVGLVGDTLVAAGSVAYLGAFTANYRKELLSSWVTKCKQFDIPISENYNLVKSMADATQILQWQNVGLPRDGYSTENAVFIKRSQKWPLLIDPQEQALFWIKEMEESHLKVVSASNPSYMRTIERAVRVGEAVILTNIDETLDPALKPILLQETFVRGGHRIIKLGDTEIEYNHNFRLYLTTTSANPHFLPAIFNGVNVINFIVTFEGLQEQLLSAVVKQMQPQLEIQRGDLLESISQDLQQLRDLEDRSLSLLQKTEGHILDDQDLIDTLQKSKGIAEEVYKRVAESEETERKLNLARKKYLPVAIRGAVLYFVLADLSLIDVMYQFSLAWFEDMFTTCINSSSGTDAIQPPSSIGNAMLSESLHPSSAIGIKVDDASIRNSRTPEVPEDLESHMNAIIQILTRSVYRVVSMALFTQHQLTYSLMLCTSVMRANAKYVTSADATDMIPELDWEIFLHGHILCKTMKADPESSSSASGTGTHHETYPSWLTEEMHQQCRHLEASLFSFSRLCFSLARNSEQWDAFHRVESPYRLMDSQYDGVTSEFSDVTGAVFDWQALVPFHRLLLIKILRSDALNATCQLFVENQLGAQYLSQGSLDIKEVYEESSCKTPLIFILSPGCDPATQLMRFAKEVRGSTLHLDMISLGQGQGPKAEELISKAQILKGRWVFLQNCHLAASWMSRLQVIVDNCSKHNSEVDPQFRLWLSSKPDPCFPVSILQKGLKMTVESPQGLKANMLRLFGSGDTGAITEHLFETASENVSWKKLIYGLCLFNSIINERKKYGPLGWNIAYEFNDSDLEVSILQLQMLLTDRESVPWAALHYLTGEVTFGGRVTDEWDRRCLHSLLRRVYCPEALKDGYSYSPDATYKPIGGHSSFIEVVSSIEALPSYDQPEVFGMADNAEKSYRDAQAAILMENMVSVQPRLSVGIAGSKKTSDEIVMEIADDILEKMPKRVEAIALPKTKKAGSNPSSADASTEDSALMTVLHQEIDRFNQLLHIIHTSLHSLVLSIKGQIIMSDLLEEAYTALLHHNIPKQWKSVSYESLKTLGSWVDDLVFRVEFFSQWAELSESRPEGISKPSSFWLPGFFFPQGFLTSVLQTHARVNMISVDSLSFDYTIQNFFSDSDESLQNLNRKISIKDQCFQTSRVTPRDGVLVCGLFLDGASWDPVNRTLEDLKPRQRFCRLPEIHFLPVQTSNLSHSEEGTSDLGELYACPLYKTSSRTGTLSSTGHSTNFVTAITLPTDRPHDFWIVRGVATLCQLDH